MSRQLPQRGGHYKGAATDCHWRMLRAFGEVPEWSNGTVSKTVVRVTVPWVRIPPSPICPIDL
jgi:hypothetical protein